MVFKSSFDDGPAEALNYADEPASDASHLLRPSFYWQAFRRRALYFLLAVVVIAGGGITATLLWPPTYRSGARILVTAQQIPSELVRSTVSSAAQERVQVLEQRIMTRDNLMTIINKFGLFSDRRSLLSPTQLVDLMKKRVQIKPIDEPLLFERLRSRGDNPTVIFTVSFDYSDPAIATAVANELVTHLLNEDLRDRMARASEATKFLSREVKTLQAESTELDSKVARIKVAQKRAAATSPVTPDGPDPAVVRLEQLKLELTQKNTLYAANHPVIQSLQNQIAALEKTIAEQPAKRPTRPGTPPVSDDDEVSLATLEARQDTLQKSLAAASAKLNAAQMGESLEKDQRAEKLEVIEQPTTPQESIQPNRPKLILLSLAAALVAGIGLVFLLEITDKAIRRTDELYRIVDRHLVVVIPYITAKSEVLHRRIKTGVVTVVVIALLAAAGYVASDHLPPLDLMITKLRVKLFQY
jgi:uncharacterized protein involved in exopolysaccharide biosynthesis